VRAANGGEREGRGYKEFAAENRPDGWNVWLTFVLSPGGTDAERPAATSRVIAAGLHERRAQDARARNREREHAPYL